MLTIMSYRTLHILSTITYHLCRVVLCTNDEISLNGDSGSPSGAAESPLSKNVISGSTRTTVGSHPGRARRPAMTE